MAGIIEEKEAMDGNVPSGEGESSEDQKQAEMIARKVLSRGLMGHHKSLGGTGGRNTICQRSCAAVHIYVMPINCQCLPFGSWQISTTLEYARPLTTHHSSTTHD